MDEELLWTNGIDASTGGYLLPPLKPEDVTPLILGESLDPDHQEELRNRKDAVLMESYALKAGLDPDDLSQAGWGVLFAPDVDQEVIEALKPLLDRREEQAGKYFRKFTGPDGVRPGESKGRFLARHGMGPSAADPEKVPYYLLIVGSPDEIPYRFQVELDVQYAVGRISFDSVEGYANYAKNVVDAEDRGHSLPKTATLFGVCNADDRPTSLSANRLIVPLGKTLAQNHSDWKFEVALSDEATKKRLKELIRGDRLASLLFCASHGLGFPNGHPRQLADQGAILCQDWPGPVKWKDQIPREFYFAGSDVPDGSDLLGRIVFLFACYGAGTPKFDHFCARVLKTPEQIAPLDFVARLPQEILGRPNGALAVVGHVDRAWGWSFMWPGVDTHLTVFDSTVSTLLMGKAVGKAVQYFNDKYAELATTIVGIQEDHNYGIKPDHVELAGIWTANKDARNYVVLGDPAARLLVA